MMHELLIPKDTPVFISIMASNTNPDIWGPDAMDFRPLRHHPESLTEEQRKALMPFGYGRLKCVASTWAPQGAALIVAAILDRLGETMNIAPGQAVGGREGWDSWKIKLASA